MARRKTCSALLIGNELLNGKTRDLNGHFLAKSCAQIGVSLKSMVTIPDDDQTIQETVRKLSEQNDFVFTSGGVGPTHDDITLPSIGAAFGKPLGFHAATQARMSNYFARQGTEFTDARKRMCFFPAEAKVYFSCPAPTSELAQAELEDPSLIRPLIPFQPIKIDAPKALVWTPIVVMNNVHVLPGIPSLYSHLISSYFTHYLFPHLKQSLDTGTIKDPVYKRMLGTSMLEGDLADYLSRVQNAYVGSVAIGSYPMWSLSEAPPTGKDSKALRVVLTFEGDDKDTVEDCIRMAKIGIPLEQVEDKEAS